MALTPKQLRLVFAKLRAEGLLRYTKKRRPTSWTLKAAKHLRKGEGALTPETLNKFEQRLPQSHRKLAQIKGGITIHPTRQDFIRTVGADSAGAYDIDTQHLHLNADPMISTVPGYTSRPAGRVGKFRVAKVSYKRKEWRISRDTAVRQGMLSHASTFYHEYAHAINYKGRFSDSGDWPRIVVREWTDIEPGEPAGKFVTGSSGRTVFISPTGERISDLERGLRALFLRGKETRIALDPAEAWSETYAQYAVNKFRKNRLKRERPESFAYTQKFFEGGK